MQAATKCRQGKVQKVMLIDFSKAHLYAPIEGELHVDSTLERAQQSCCTPCTGCDCCQQVGAGVPSDLGGGGICARDCLEVPFLPPEKFDT